MKSSSILITALLLIIMSTRVKAQVRYVVVSKTDVPMDASGHFHIGAFTPLPRRFIATLYNDALVFDEGYDGKGDKYYKFARKVNSDAQNIQRWNAVDNLGGTYDVRIVDLNTSSLIAIKSLNGTNYKVYQTL